MSQHDSFQRFLFEELGIRGEIVRLDDSWATVRSHHAYPAAVESQLGQALAAAVLLSGTIKFDGSLILQIQGDGPVSTLVAQATDTRTIRGMAIWSGEPGGSNLGSLFGDGRMILTIQSAGREPYQGIVPLEGENLAEAIETYFNQSEQLPTRLWLAADGGRAAGLFLQGLPSHSGDPEDWNRVNHLANTITPSELLSLDSMNILYRLFHEETVRLFEPEPVVFRCQCSRTRIMDVLRSLGQPELESLLAERGSIEVDCEFCNRRHHFDTVDVGALFSETPARASGVMH